MDQLSFRSRILASALLWTHLAGLVSGFLYIKNLESETNNHNTKKLIEKNIASDGNTTQRSRINSRDQYYQYHNFHSVIVIIIVIKKCGG